MLVTIEILSKHQPRSRSFLHCNNNEITTTTAHTSKASDSDMDSKTSVLWTVGVKFLRDSEKNFEFKKEDTCIFKDGFNW